jgi:acyl carrier protein
MSKNELLMDIAIDALYEALSTCNIHPEADLNKATVKTTTIASLALDSLDLLQMAMDVEEVLDVELDVVEFPGDATLWDVAEHFQKLMVNKGSPNT